MDRELLIEIGVEEIPASWLPGLTTQLATRLDARLKELRLPPAAADRDVQHAAASDRARRQARRTSDRFRRGDDRAAGVRRLRRRAVSRRRPRSASRARTTSRSRRSSGVETPKGTYLAFAKQLRGKAAVDVLPDVMTGLLRTMTFPEDDAVGRDRSTTARASCRSAVRFAGCCFSTAAASCRSRSIARARARPAGAGDPLRRGDLRPSLPDDQRTRRARDQGQGLRRLSQAAGRELRRARAQRAAGADRARARRRGAPARRTRLAAGGRSVAAAAKCRTSSNIRRSSPARSPKSS